MTVSNPSLEPGGVPRPHGLLTLVGDEHDFSLKDVDELVLVGVLKSVGVTSFGRHAPTGACSNGPFGAA